MKSRNLQTNNDLETGDRTNATAIDGGGGTEGNLLDTIKKGANDVVDEVKGVLNTSPPNWTTGQIVGVAIGVAVALLLLLLMCCCCCRRRRNEKKRAKYTLTKPLVTRGAGIAVDARRNLPLGVKLHGAEKLREAGLTGKGVRVAVIDSGIDSDHIGFDGKVAMKKWYRFGTPLAEDDHGTHVAGTIHFMAPDAELCDYRVFGEKGEIDGDNAIAKSIRHAVDTSKCNVINMSLRVSYPVVPAVKSAVKYAHSKGVHMVCAAGNSGDGDPLTNEMYSFPARMSETISVAAVKKAGNLPVASFSESNPQVDFAAIGVNVMSLKPGGGFQSMQGTSMASPHVAGLIAALLTKDTYSSDKQLRQDLAQKYVIDIAAEGPDKATGVGFLTFLSKDEFDTFWQSSNGGQGMTAAQMY